jgi:predicted DNA-binding protein YlxM (UPF0122 family)
VATSLESKYPMNTREGVITFLENYNHIKSSMYFQGDYNALIMLVDFEIALLDSKLTERELFVLIEVFIKDIKRVDVAEKLGVTKQTIQTLITRATEKIARYYDELGDYSV